MAASNLAGMVARGGMPGKGGGATEGDVLGAQLSWAEDGKGPLSLNIWARLQPLSWLRATLSAPSLLQGWLG